jgi:hypothetical protein
MDEGEQKKKPDDLIHALVARLLDVSVCLKTDYHGVRKHARAFRETFTQ